MSLEMNIESFCFDCPRVQREVNGDVFTETQMVNGVAGRTYFYKLDCDGVRECGTETASENRNDLRYDWTVCPKSSEILDNLSN